MHKNAFMQNYNIWAQFKIKDDGRKVKHFVPTPYVQKVELFVKFLFFIKKFLEKIFDLSLEKIP